MNIAKLMECSPGADGNRVLHLHHAAAVHHGAAAGRSARGRRSDRGDGKFHLGRAGFLELQRHSDRIALFQGMFEVEEHQVDARRLKHDRLARLDLEPLLSAGRIFMTPFSIVMLWIWHLALASLETQLSRSGVEPLLVIVM